ncbi:MAG: signal peptidase I [Peptococcaceae bacterium]|jgi:signal peptidase I|nr:signal peptidase I [Peptococcaceae bacterium]
MRLKSARSKVWIGVLAGVIVLAGLLRWFVWQPYQISSTSMEPALLSGDRVLINQFTMRFWAPSRGDIVVFAYPLDPRHTFVKRVIALPGESVELRDNQALINGRVLQEPYLKPGDYPPFPPETVPEDKVFVLGDNRQESSDSREWGLLPRDHILGKYALTYYPFSRWGISQ